MKTPIQTPFGRFPSQIDAARYIFENGFKEAFDAAFPETEWRRHDWKDRYEEQNLFKPVQDICDVIRQLVAKKVPGWF